MNKPKILFILHYPPPVHGAAMVGQYIRESNLINNELKGRYLNLGTSRTVTEIGKGGLKKWWRYIVLLWKTLFNILFFRPNLVYLTLTATSGGFYKDALVAIKAKMLGAKMVYHFHNKGVSTRQDRWLDNFLYKIVFKNADVILLSEHLYPDIQKYVPKDRVHICPNGIPELAKNLEADTKEREEKTVQILFLSNLMESKGVYVLLNACKILKNRGVLFNCTYVGGESDISRTQLEQKVIELGLLNQVSYQGRKYGSEKIDVFLRADIFAFPTYFETFGLVNLEAMQFNLPIVSTFEGGIPEIVENNKTGFLVLQKDAIAFADKLELLIKNPDMRTKMGDLGRKKYEVEFTLSAFEERFTSILLDLSY